MIPDETSTCSPTPPRPSTGCDGSGRGNSTPCVFRRASRCHLEVALQVRVNDVRVTGLEQLIHPAQRVFAAPCRGESRSCARRNRARRSAPAPSAAAVWTTRSRTVGIPSGRRSLTPRLGDVVAADRLRAVVPASQFFAESSSGSSSRSPLEPRASSHDRPRPLLVGGDFTERRPQGPLGIDLVDQAEPLASLDPLVRGPSTSARPDRRFDPAQRPRVSPSRLALRILPPVGFPSLWTSRLHLPAPLRSPGITRLPRYYGCSDSWARLFGSYVHEHRLYQPPRSPCVLSPNLPIIPSPTTFRRPGAVSGFCCVGLTGPPRCGRPFRGRASLGLRHWLAGSPRRSAESSSLALRTNRSPPVALHPASRRRSYLRLRAARTPRQGLSPC